MSAALAGPAKAVAAVAAVTARTTFEIAKNDMGSAGCFIGSVSGHYLPGSRDLLL